ncbi:hypothetical protein LWI28_021468 [Acer negundo]|uniref:Uncharacterized protein n=1 Tax=Acer negundo TaxID=4023 RepID=A0AAD5NYS6_ACENE|nr:hypothetical protein LWI28_021468 [Acer negundo]
MVETFLTCTDGSFSIEATSLETRIKDSSNVPVGKSPEEAMKGGRETSMDDDPHCVSLSLFLLIVIIISSRHKRQQLKSAGEEGELLGCCHLEPSPGLMG